MIVETGSISRGLSPGMDRGQSWCFGFRSDVRTTKAIAFLCYQSTAGLRAWWGGSGVGCRDKFVVLLLDQPSMYKNKQVYALNEDYRRLKGLLTNSRLIHHGCQCTMVINVMKNHSAPPIITRLS